MVRMAENMFRNEYKSGEKAAGDSANKSQLFGGSPNRDFQQVFPINWTRTPFPSSINVMCIDILTGSRKTIHCM